MQEALKSMKFILIYRIIIGNLAWTCASGTKSYPFILGGSDTDCPTSIYVTGFDIDPATDNFVVSGYVAAATTT